MSNSSPHAKKEGCIRLAEEGLYSRAINRLLSSGTQAESDAVYAKLQALHPKNDEDFAELAEELKGIAEETVLDEETTVLAIQSFDRMTASGAMGLKASVLRQLLSLDESKTFTRAIHSFVCRLAKGEVPKAVWPYLGGACLTALPKPEEGVPPEKWGTRPVAAGEIIRRIVGKSLANKVIPGIASHFMPHQFGVGAKGGSARIAHMVRRCVAQHLNDDDFVGLKVDMSNAFNNMSRRKLLEAVHKVPGLAMWVIVTYSQKSVLWFGSRRLSSEEGGQQGDPLLPLLFALVLHPLILKAEDTKPFLNLWYLDDGVLFGTHAVIQRIVEILEGEEATKLGMFLNPGKCELIWLRPEAVREDAFPARFKKRIHDGNFEILGTPVGSAEFVKKKVGEAMRDADKIWQGLSELDDAQVAYTLLRACANWNKVAHLTQTVPPSLFREAGTVFDEGLRKAFAGISTVIPTDKAWLQCTLPTTTGGLGLRSSVAHAPAAYVASVLMCSHLSTALGPKIEPTEFQGFEEAVCELNTRVDVAPVDLASFSPIKAQQGLSKLIDARTLRELKAGEDRYGLARLQLVTQQGVGEWLNVLPSPKTHTKMTSPEFVISLRRWLGLPVYDTSLHCTRCGRAIADTLGNHSLTCAGDGSRVVRHHDVRDIFASAARGARLEPVVEPNNLPFTKGRPADFVTREGQHRYINDVCVTHPLGNAVAINLSADEPGAAIEAYTEKEKVKPFERSEAAAHYKYRALAFDSFGGMGQSTREYVKELARASAMRVDGSSIETEKMLVRRLVFAVVRQSARMILLRDQPATHPTEQEVPNNHREEEEDEVRRQVLKHSCVEDDEVPRAEKETANVVHEAAEGGSDRQEGNTVVAEGGATEGGAANFTSPPSAPSSTPPSASTSSEPITTSGTCGTQTTSTREEPAATNGDGEVDHTIINTTMQSTSSTAEFGGNQTPRHTEETESAETPIGKNGLVKGGGLVRDANGHIQLRFKLTAQSVHKAHKSSSEYAKRFIHKKQQQPEKCVKRSTHLAPTNNIQLE